jgi:hypothetical protein
MNIPIHLPLSPLPTVKARISGHVTGRYSEARKKALGLLQKALFVSRFERERGWMDRDTR